MKVAGVSPEGATAGLSSSGNRIFRRNSAGQASSGTHFDNAFFVDFEASYGYGFGAAISQLPLVLLWAGSFLDRHLDAADRHDLAGLQVERFGFYVGAGRFLQPGAHSPIRILGRRLHRPLEPPPDDHHHAGPGDVAGRDPGSDHADRRGHCLASDCVEHYPGRGQRLRHARPAGVPRADDRRPRASDQRHRLELVDVQRGPAGGAGDCRFPDRGGGRMALLSRQRDQLRGGLGRFAGDAVDASRPERTAQARLPRAAGRFPLCLRIPSDSVAAAVVGRSEPRGDAADGAHADLRLASASRRAGNLGSVDRRHRRGRWPEHSCWLPANPSSAWAVRSPAPASLSAHAWSPLPHPRYCGFRSCC